MNTDEFERQDDDSQAERRNVLLVEDDALVAMATGNQLEDLGWTVIGPAATLDEAMALVSSDVPLDAALVDINLQGRWAHALAEELNRRQVPFVVCTGYEMIDPDQRFAGAPLIAKPIAPERLGEALDSLLAAKVPCDETPRSAD